MLLFCSFLGIKTQQNYMLAYFVTTLFVYNFYYIGLKCLIKENFQYIYQRMHCQDQISSYNLKLLLVNQADGSSREFPVIVPFIPGSREIRINQALDDTCQRYMNLYGAQLFQVDFVNRMHRFLGVYPIDRQIRIGYENIVNNTIQIHVRPLNRQKATYSQIKQEEAGNFNSETKGRKVKERSIQEAVESVKFWRKLYETDDGKGKRLYTLDQAAKIVGIAKKTLDDYYSLIRTAINFNFNLQKYKDSKVGILRKFVKICKQQGQQGINNKMAEYLYDQNIQKYWASLDDL